MAKHRSSSLWCSPLSIFIPRTGETLWYSLALISILSLLIHRLSLSANAADSHFEGFDADEDEGLDDESLQLTDLPRRTPPPTTITHSEPESDHGPPNTISDLITSDESPQPADLRTKASSSSDFYWDEDEFEGLPEEQPQESIKAAEDVVTDDSSSDSKDTLKSSKSRFPQSYAVEIVCGSFLIMFVINYFTGKKENEHIALAWAAKFAGKDSIFEKNFSLMGVGEGDDSPLLLKEGQTVFKFYASGRRFCQGLLATMELQSRHDLISRLYNAVVPCKDEITFEVYMNDDAMDQVVFALAKKKLAKTMQKEVRDLQKFGNLITPPSNRKWVTDDLVAISESKEVSGDLITETVLEQVFGEKAFEKYGKGFISMHFSDQHPTENQRKALVFKFALPDANHMADMSRLIALVPYYIDFLGRYKLSSQARAKTEAPRQKAAQEAYKEYQLLRQEALQKKKAERRKVLEEGETKLSSEAIRKKESKERSRQLKKAMPKMKMTRAH
ncbi:uncharacterized protein At5g49945-like [Impatiens glandulifera]|uniref:uncharacterized protein At5g49945-like n=1 Tax=Impatiens glandulifera TaxID=253017 RepID=UPI001FB062DA|nr:uncharacterized protein At5g49945-like [Impatiens glandulifera]